MKRAGGPDPKPTKGDAVWRMLESEPGFNEKLRAAEAELEAGGGERYEVRDGGLRRTDGGRAKRDGDREWSRVCAVCGYARINVRHNVTPESQAPEGRDYYAAMTDLHEFVPSERFTR